MTVSEAEVLALTPAGLLRRGDGRRRRARNGEPQAFLEAAFLAETDECILWPYGCSGTGYGQISFYPGPPRLVHAVILERATPRPGLDYEAAHGPCVDRRRCINRRHLRWATCAENNADKIRDGTTNRGAAHLTQLTLEDVREIRRLGLEGVQFRQITTRFPLHERSVADIIQGRTWAWLP